MSESSSWDWEAAITVENKQTKADLQHMLVKLGIIPEDPLSGLMKALEAGAYNALQTYGQPNTIMMDPRTFKALTETINKGK